MHMRAHAFRHAADKVVILFPNLLSGAVATLGKQSSGKKEPKRAN